ncbi:MAG: hypothetical protein JWQ39_1263 [Glaciihabitans sp.]|nr:hypothetical protein [Glaciihabitans sp.]
MTAQHLVALGGRGGVGGGVGVGVIRLVGRLVSVVVCIGVALALAGCQTNPNRFGGTQAKAEAANWMRQATQSIAPASASPRSNSPIPCPTDHSYFATKFAWRNFTTVVVDGNPDAALSLVERTLTQAGWRSRGARPNVSGQMLILTSPLVHGDHGTVTVESATGSPELTLSAVSACYDG